MKEVSMASNDSVHSGSINKNVTAYKVTVSIIFGLLGFAVNFYPVDFVFYSSHRMSFLFGLLFPMLITLAWGWRYGLLSALCGGCQTMWILWLPGSGYGAYVSVPPFILWIVWLGWFSRTKHNIYVGEILFRIFNTALLYTVFRWVFALNAPPHNVGIPLTVVHSIVFKELVNGLLILFIAQALLHSIRVRNFFKLPENQTDPRMYYIYLNAVILGGILIFGFVGEKYIWGMWGPEFQNLARILGSLLLLLIGIFCTYSAANGFSKRKTEELVRAEDRIEHLNLVLRAIRNVNQLIIKEKDRDKLLKGTCDNLIETRGYHSAWIALLDESGNLDTAAQAGLGDDFQPMLDRFKRGKLMHCVRLTKEQSGVFVIQDQSSACGDCPLAGNFQDRAAATIRLEYEGKVYGLMSVAIPAHVAEDKEEQSLFREVAGDIAFALSSLEAGEMLKLAEDERRRADEALKESEERLRKLFDNMNSGVAVYEADDNGNDFVFNDFNRAGERIENIKKENIIGKSVLEVFPGVREFGLFDVFKRVWETGKTEDHPSAFYKDERIIGWRENNVYKLPSNEIVVVYNDITDRKLAEEELAKHREHLEELVEERTKKLKDAQDQLVRREKLAILGQLAGGVSHELRNPLGVISNAVYYLKMVQPDADETVKEYLETISEEVNRSTQIVSDLLDFSRVKSVEREETAVSDLIAEVLEKQTSPENVKVTATIPSDLPSVFIDLRRIRQVFDNLITNACQAMPEGGKLSISAIAEQDKVHILFTDTGSGISEENMEKVFEPLFTTKARGIGLGLAVSRNLVEANGGSIEVESEEDKGSTFTVILSCKEVA